MSRRPFDLSGQPFGRLTAIRPAGRQSGAVVWSCRCSCGAMTNVLARQLRNGRTQSCGCLRRDLTGDRFRDPGRAQWYARLRAKGWTLRRFAAHYGVSFQAVGHALRKLARPATSAGALSFTGEG